MAPEHTFLRGYSLFRMQAEQKHRVPLPVMPAESDFLRTALRYVISYDTCPMVGAAQWAMAESRFGGFTAEEVSAAFTVDTMRVTPRYSKQAWVYGVLEAIRREQWEQFSAYCQDHGAMWLKGFTDGSLRGAHIFLRGTLYPYHATEVHMMTAIAKSKLYTCINSLEDMYVFLFQTYGDRPAQVDGVMLFAAEHTGWDRFFDSSGNASEFTLSYAEHLPPNAELTPITKGNRHARTPTRSIRGPKQERRYRAGY